MDFFQEFKNIFYSSPRNAINSRSSENCDYGDYIFRSKNTYLSYFLSECEDSYYSQYLSKCRDCVDCEHVAVGELCYDCVDCTGIYNSSFMQDCHNCSNCEFCFDCINCKDCFGCFGLRHKEFCVFNKPYTEAVYRQKMAIFKKQAPEKILEVLRPEFEKHPRLYARQLKGGENAYGDYIYFSKNCFQCFNVRDVENCAYVSEVANPEAGTGNCVDCDYSNALESCYECYDVTGCTNCNFLLSCGFCNDSEYMRNCYNCQNCFGCVYLMNKQYCILNRQFTREEYVVALKKIKTDLKTTKIYGKTLAEILK